MPRRKTSVTKSDGNGANAPLISDNVLVLSVYVLYLVGFATGFTALIGAVIAYLKSEQSAPVCQSHFKFQVRTFLIGLLYVVLGGVTVHVGIGALILLWWFIWTLIRCVKGLLALNAGQPIRDPNSWLFG
jgi:uncharacterized membrane protein